MAHTPQYPPSNKLMVVYDFILFFMDIPIFLASDAIGIWRYFMSIFASAVPYGNDESKAHLFSSFSFFMEEEEEVDGNDARKNFFLP